MADTEYPLGLQIHIYEFLRPAQIIALRQASTSNRVFRIICIFLSFSRLSLFPMLSLAAWDCVGESVGFYLTDDSRHI